MMLLVTTLCLAIGPDAECRQATRYVSGDVEVCKATGRALAQYIIENNTAVPILHLSIKCMAGKDT